MLNDLEKQKLITPEEKSTIKETGEVTIGSRTIIFEKIVALESRISIENDGIYIVVNFKNNNYYSYAKNILEGKTEDEMMDMFVESKKYYVSDYYEENYPGREIDKDLVLEDYEAESLFEIAQGHGYDTIEEFLIYWCYVKPEEFQSLEKVEGEITDPDGNVVQVNPDTDLKYKVTQDSTYTFLGKTSNGNTAKLDVTTNLENEYRLTPETNMCITFLLKKGYGEIIDIIEEYSPKIKVEGSEDEIDLIPAINDYGEIDIGFVGDQIPIKGTATIYLTINGNRIVWKGIYDLSEQ